MRSAFFWQIKNSCRAFPMNSVRDEGVTFSSHTADSLCSHRPREPGHEHERERSALCGGCSLPPVISDLHIQEHSTVTFGSSDHVFVAFGSPGLQMYAEKMSADRLSFPLERSPCSPRNVELYQIPEWRWSSAEV